MTHALRPFVALTLLALGCGDAAAPGPQIRIDRFDASPASVAPGETSILAWTVEGAEQVSIAGGGGAHAGLEAQGTLSVTVGATTAFTLTASAEGEEVSAETTVTVDDTREAVPPEIQTFRADPEVLAPGAKTKLVWEVRGATALSISGGDAAMDLQGEEAGEREVAPEVTTTYVLEATGPGGVTTAEVAVRVDNPIVTSFTATPASAREGQPVRLEWVTEHADTITIQPSVDAGRDLGPEDAVDVYPGVGATTYVLNAAHSDGGVAAVAEVEVNVHAPPQIVAFSVSPDAAVAGEAVFLVWQTVGVDRVVVEGLPEGSVVAEDRVQEADGYPVIAIESTTFRLVASGPGGQVEAEAALVVHQRPIVDRFVADPPEIALGGATILRWGTSDADSVEITPSPGEAGGELAPDGSAEVSPMETTTYQITATGPGGVAEASTEVVVHPPPVIDLFEATPAQVSEGSNVTLRWSTLHATSVALDPDPNATFPVDLVSGTFGVQPAQTTTFTLTAQSPGGEVQAQVEVVVLPRPSVGTFVVEPAEVTFGEEVTLTWTTQDATSVVLDPALAGFEEQQVQGSHTFRPPGTGSYLLTAVGPGGRSNARSVRVTVHPRPIIRFLRVAPEVVRLGENATISWEVDHALRVWFDPGPANPDLALAGELALDPGPGVTTEYVLHAESGFGADLVVETARVTLTVLHPPSVERFVASSPEVLVGGGVEIFWEVNDADEVTITNRQGVPLELGAAAEEGSGSVRIEDIRLDQIFTLSARGPGGDLDELDEPTVEVVVRPARLLISEVFFDRPGGTDRGWEWVELYNPTDVTVPLSTYSLGVGTDDWRASAAELTGLIPPGGCWVVGGSNSGPDNHDPVIDVEVFPRGFSPTLADAPTGVVALGVHFIPKFSLPADRPDLVPLDAVLYGWRNSAGFVDHHSAPDPAPVHFQLYELEGDGSISVDAANERVRRIQSGWSIARTSPRADEWLPQDTPTPGVCFENRPRPGVGWCQIQHPADPLVVASGDDTEELFGRVYSEGVTEGVGQGGGVRAQVGLGPVGTHPDANVFWTWEDAAYHADLNNRFGELNDDEYVGTLVAPADEGDYAWAFRFEAAGRPGEWLYCDQAPGNDGSGGDAAAVFDPDDAGVLTVVGAL